MKKIITYILTIGLCLIMNGCSSAGGISTFTAAVEKMPTNFDPQIATDNSDLMVISNVFDGLFEIQNGEVINNLAESCNISSDGRKYTIRIKEDNLFRCRGDKKEKFDGTIVTAKDFAFALNRILDKNTHSPYREDFSNIKSISTPDDYTLIIQLDNPDYNFSEKLAMTAAYPCNEEFFRRTGGAYGLTIENILSNGPFRLNYLDSEGGNGTIVRVSEDDKAIQRIRIKVVEADNQADSYINEEISGYYSHSSENLKYENTSSITFDSGNISLMFNLAKPEFDNEKIRQALGWYAFGFENSGANMAAVHPTSSIFPNTITVAGRYINDIITPDKPGYMNSNPKNVLQEGLNELGIAKLNSVKILMPNDSIYTIIYENINQLWQKNLGQFFTIEYLPTSQIKWRVNRGQFDIAFLPMTPANNTPYGILQMFTPYSSTLSAIVDNAKSTADQNRALPLIEQAENLILSRAMVVPMGNEQTVFYYRNYFKNIYTDPFTNVINLKQATVN